MEQLRLGFAPQDLQNPFTRLASWLLTTLVGLALAALVIFVLLPVLGIIVSAAVGGVILALAGIIMMIPFVLVAGAVLAIMAKAGIRRPGILPARSSHWR